MASRSSSKRTLTLPGTARNQGARRKELIAAIRSSIREAERTIANGRRLLAQAEEGITPNLLVECVNALGLHFNVARVLGVEIDYALPYDGARMQLIDAIEVASGSRRAIRTDGRAVAAAADTASPISRIATSALPCAAPTALEEAAAIARSAGGDVDWHREPLTERERRIRARWIERHLDGTYEGALALTCRAASVRLRIESSKLRSTGSRPEHCAMPTDLAAAEVEATAILERYRCERDAEEYRELDDLDDDLGDE